MINLMTIAALVFSIVLPGAISAEGLSTQPELVWKVETMERIWTAPALIGDSLFCISAIYGTVSAYRPDGSLAWKNQTGLREISSPLVAPDNTIYLIAKEVLIALNPDGSQKWTFHRSAAKKADSDKVGKTSSYGRDKAYSAPAIGSDGTVYAPFSGALYAVDSDGSLVWKMETGTNREVSTPAIGPDGTIYITNSDDTLYALDQAGDVKWTFKNWGYDMQAPVVDHRGRVYLCDSQTFTCVGASGEELWRFIPEHGNGFRYSGPVIDENGTVYIVDGNGVIRAFDINGVKTWEYNWGKSPWRSTPIVAEDGVIYIMDRDGWLLALDRDGVLLYEFQAGTTQRASPMLTDSGILLFGAYDGFLHAYQTDSPGIAKNAVWPCEGCDNSRSSRLDREGNYAYIGGLVTDTSSGDIVQGMVITANPGSYTAVSGNDGRYTIMGLPEGAYSLTAEMFGYLPVDTGNLTARTGEQSERDINASRDRKWIKWKNHIGGAISGNPAIGDDGTIYVGSSSSLSALNPDGSEKWRYETVVTSSPVLDSNGAIYFASYKTLIVLDTEGDFDWAYMAPSGIGTPTVAQDGTVYFGCSDNKFYAVGPGGELEWQITTEDDNYSKPVVGFDGTVYFTQGNLFYAVDEFGTVLWTHAGSRYTCHAPLIGSDGTLYHGDNSDNLYALNKDGSLQWTAHVEPSSEPSIGADGTLYFPAGRTVQAYSPNGKLKWRKEMETDIIGTPTLGSDGIIYFGTNYYNQICAMTNEGYLTWKFRADGTPNGSPAIGNDGVVYFGTDSGFLYAIQTRSYGYEAGAEWPSCGKDNRNSSQQDQPPGSVIISGIATDAQSGDPVSGAEIRVMPGNYSTVTNSLGEYRIILFETGIYTVEAASPGMLAQSNKDIDLSESKSTTLDIAFERDDIWIKWKTYVGDPYNFKPSLCTIAVGDDGSIYVQSKYSISALNADGEILWKVETEIDLHTSPSIADDGSIRYTDNYIIVSINSNGSRNWKIQNWHLTTAAVAADGTTYYNGNYDDQRFIYAYAPDGIQLWKFPANRSDAPPVINTDGAIISGGDGRGLVAVTPQGELAWRYSLSVFPESPLAIGPDNTTYFIQGLGTLYAVLPNGSVKYRFYGQQAKTVPDLSPVVGPDNTVYFIDGSNYLYAVNTDGTLKWKHHDNYSKTAPALSGDGRLFIATKDGRLLIFAPDGTLVFDKVYGDSFSYAPKLLPDGTLYLFSDTGFLYALQTDSPGYPEETCWPCMHGDNKNSNRAKTANTGPSMAGYVRDAGSGEGIGNALITIEPGGITSTTNSDGYYEIIGLVAGSYTVSVTIFGYGREDDIPVNLISGSGNKLDIALNQGDVSLIWVYEATLDTERLGENTIEAPMSLAHDGTIIFANHKSLAALSPDRELLWKHDINPGRFGVSVDKDGSIYVGASHDSLYVLHADGSFNWAFEMFSTPEGIPAIGSDGRVYAGTQWRQFYALDTSGTLYWEFPLAHAAHTPAIGQDGTVYIGTNTGTFYAVNPDGTLKWEGRGGGYKGAAIGADGTIYSCESSTVYAYDPDGTEKWNFNTGERISASPVIDSDGTIYQINGAGRFVALYPDGTLKWEFQAQGVYPSSPSIGADGVIYFGDSEGILYALDTAGELIWSFDTGGYILGAPLISEDGVVYVGNFAGLIHAFQTESYGLKADAPWPTVAQNNQRTSLMPKHLVSVEKEQVAPPTAFSLGLNRPNPFNPVTVIPFDIPRESHVRITVYTIAGEKIGVLAENHFPTGKHTVTWDASKHASGVYFCRMEAGEFVETRKMMLVK